MNRTTKRASIDVYLAAAPPDRRPALEQLRAAIRAAAPEVGETVSYSMPAFAQRGSLVYFANMKSHIGLYPTAGGIAALREELSAYESTKAAFVS